MSIIIKEAAGALAISKETLKSKHLRITGTLDDSSLDDLYIPSAISFFEFYTGLSLIEKTYIQSFDRFPCDRDHFLLERMSPPDDTNGSSRLTVNSIYYWNTAGNFVEWDSSNYVVNQHDKPISVQVARNSNWPSDVDYSRLKAIQVDFTCGYGTTEADIPKEIHHCLAMIVGNNFVFREDDLYSAGGTIAQPSRTTIDFLDSFRTGFYEYRSQSGRN